MNFAFGWGDRRFKMKKFIKLSPKKLVAAGLIFSLVVFCSSPVLASKEVCENALTRCGVDALIAGLFSGPQTFMAYYAGCLMGYSWCLRYYVPEG
jgi:hypothetical protein